MTRALTTRFWFFAAPVLTLVCALLSGAVLAVGWALDTGVIAFSAGTMDARDVYLLDTAQGRVFNLTRRPSSYGAPVWSPDGTMIAFPQNDQIYVMSSVGGVSRKVTHGSEHYESDPAWSPDSQALVFVSNRDGAENVHLARLGDGLVQNLTNINTPSTFLYGPKISPDGQWLATVEQRSFGSGYLAVYGMTTGEARRFESPLDYISIVSGLTWSPDNQYLLFAATQDGEQNDIYTLDIQSGAAHQLNDDYFYDDMPVWSADGSRITFLSNRAVTLDIFVMNADGSSILNLSHSPARDINPAWSPDGAAIAYTSDAGSGAELMLVDVATGTTRQMTHGRYPFMLRLAWKP